MSPSNRYHQSAAGPSQNQLPPLDNLSDDYGAHQTISPRSELLSPSSTERRRTHGTQDTSSRRRHRRTSDKHSRTKDAPSDTSQRELLRIVLEQEAEADNLKKALRTTLQQLDEESQKVVEYERGTKETAERFRQINESRLAAEQQAVQANQQLHLYEFQLENAQKEILTAQETLRLLEKQKEDAEELAARARARARKLHQQQIVLQAKEEGRRMGFEAGIKQAQEELVITATARRAMAQQEKPSRGSRRKEREGRRSKEATPLPQPPLNDFVEREESDVHHEDETFDANETMDPQEGEGDGDSETLRSPIITRTQTYPPREREDHFQHSTYDSSIRPSASLPQPSISQRPLDPSRTPDIQVYSIPIPPQEEISSHPSHRPSGWVTAQEHRDINGPGSHTSRNTSRQTLRPEREQMPAAVHFTPQKISNPAVVPIQRPQGPGSAPPMQIYPPERYNGPPPLKSSGSAKKILRFPSLAKTKAQSWYRSLSLRKKSKTVIDPIDEEPRAPPHQQNGNGNTNSETSSGRELYKAPIPAPATWYRPSSDQKSRTSLLKPHSRAASMDDRGVADRLSRASTRFSQFDMISSAPPNRQQGDTTSISGRSTLSKRLGQKLSIIKEDSQSMRASPLTGQLSAPNTGPIPFTLPPQSIRPSSSHSRKCPSELLVPNPPGFDPNDPFVQGNYHLFPNANPNGIPVMQMPSAPSTGRSAAIDINVQPATASFSQPATTSAPNTGNHLTPNYVYQPPTNPMRKPRGDPAMMNWDQVAPSNASHRSRQSTQSKGHRATQSYDEKPQGHVDNRSRTASAGGQVPQGMYHADLNRSMGEPPQPRPSSRSSRAQEQGYYDPRPASVRSKNPGRDGSAQLLGEGQQGPHRVASRSSMHSKYDPTEYTDPAFYAPDGSVPDPAALHAQRPVSRISSPGLEYV